jgi:hypothetical protein
MSFRSPKVVVTFGITGVLLAVSAIGQYKAIEGATSPEFSNVFSPSQRRFVITTLQGVKGAGMFCSTVFIRKEANTGE